MAKLTPLTYHPPKASIPVAKIPPINNINVIIQEENFPLCCGIQVLGHAEDDDGNSPLPACAASGFEESLVAAEGSTGGLLVYTTTQDQQVERAALEKAGFSVVADFINPNSHNNIWLHAKLVNQPRSNPRQGRKARQRAADRRRRTAASAARGR